ncbi:MAG: glycine cleavage system aminomethyltransferase GcvT [Christensenellaceae bacterium]|nr:glycine cleavage system aminomethyltransferase GcvT [Christensenellaceae bacterium]
MCELKRTPLYDAHVAAGATMVDFGGWEMPIQYPNGIINEHLYDRKHCGIFDVSHMGRLIIEGPERVAFLQKVLSSNVAALVPGRAQYCIIPNENGGAVDDAYLYMYEEDRYMLVVNASNTDKDLEHFAKYLPGFDCTITNISDIYSSIAVQGPDSDRILKVLSGGKEITGPKRNDLNELDFEGHTVRASKTGYTGDPIGWELFIDAKDVNWLWNRLIELGAQPTALGARDTLRLEAGLPLYGHEMGIDHAGNEMPIFAVSLARFAVNFSDEKGDFIAKDILKDQKENGTAKKVLPISLIDRGVMRAGMDIFKNGEHIGWVTSGTMVPYYDFDEDGNILDTTGKRSIGFAYVDASVAADDIIEIDVRGKKLKAKVVSKHMSQTEPPYARAILNK